MDRSEKIKELVEKGLSSRKIAEIEGISPNSVNYWVKKLNLRYRLSKNHTTGERPPKQDLSNKKFGFLIVIKMEKMGKDHAGKYKALCRCTNCGNEHFLVNPGSLLRGVTTSCGCRRDFYEKTSGENNTRYKGYKDITGKFWRRLTNRKDKIEVSIKIEQAYDLLLKQEYKCALSGMPLSFGRADRFNETTASLDRIDVTKSYSLDNVQWVHKHVNIMKNIFNQDYFIYLCNKVSLTHSIDTSVNIERYIRFGKRRIQLSNTIKAYKGNIFDYIIQEHIDCIFNASNAIGVMGCGIAGAIKNFGGKSIQVEAYNYCQNYKPLPGEAFRTTSGNLLKKGVNCIIHAVTMKNPGEKSSYEVIEKAFKSALLKASDLGAKKIGCTALGTGIGKLDPCKVATIMHQIAQTFLGKMDIIFVDMNPVFIDRINDLCDSIL